MKRRSWIRLVGVTIIFCLLSGIAHGKESIRHPSAAGSFYPPDTKRLKEIINEFISKVGAKQVKGEILGLLCPHAGYIFSGQVAAYSYNEIKKLHYDTVVILGPSHYVYLHKASVGKYDSYATPLGNLPVNQQIVSTLLKQRDLFAFSEHAHLKEHSIETQIPFLQCVLKDFDIVPILIGVQPPENCLKIAKAVAEALHNRNALFIASSDLSHYPDYDSANRIDKKSLFLIEKCAPESLFNSEASLLKKGIPNLTTTLCGLSAVATLKMIMKEFKVNNAKTLHYANSGDIPVYGHAQKQKVVGYGAVAFYR